MKNLLTRAELLNQVDYNRSKGVISKKGISSPVRRDNKKLRLILETQDGKKTFYVHRLVFFLENDYWPEFVDHKDGNVQNNHFSNLRECTQAENNRNRFKKAKTTSQYKGVCWEKRRSKWLASIRFEGKQIWIGRFDSEVEAAKAYNRKAMCLFGEFAQLNQLDTNHERLIRTER